MIEPVVTVELRVRLRPPRCARSRSAHCSMARFAPLTNVPPALREIALDGVQIAFVVWYARDLRVRETLRAAPA
jgi:hypothetical protein